MDSITSREAEGRGGMDLSGFGCAVQLLLAFDQG